MTEQEYQSHPLRNTLQRLRDLRPHASLQEEVFNGTPEILAARDRIFSIGSLLETLIEATPASFASSGGMNNIDSSLQQIVNEINNYTNNRALGHIQNAVNYVDQAQSSFWAFPHLMNGKKSPLPKILSDQAEVAQQAIAILASTRDALAVKLSNLVGEADELKLRLTEMSENGARERAESTAAIAKLELQFIREEAARNLSATEKLAVQESSFEQVVIGAKNSAQDILDDLDSKRRQASEIVQVVGNIGVTGNYQKIADAESKQADFWRIVTVIVFGIGISIAVGTFVRYWGEPVTGVSAASIGIRLLYAIAITAPAWYTAKESARHRTNADRARQTELELASIGPFIELMPTDKKDNIREELTKRYFGQVVAAHSAEPPVSISDVKDLVLEAIKAASKKS